MTIGTQGEWKMILSFDRPTVLRICHFLWQGRRFWMAFSIWFITQRQRSSTANSARSTRTTKWHRPPEAKNVKSLSDVVVMIANRKVSRVVWSLFSVVRRRHRRRSHFVSHAKDARNHQCIASEDSESSNGQSIRRRSTQNQPGKVNKLFLFFYEILWNNIMYV